MYINSCWLCLGGCYMCAQHFRNNLYTCNTLINAPDSLNSLIVQDMITWSLSTLIRTDMYLSGLSAVALSWCVTWTNQNVHVEGMRYVTLTYMILWCFVWTQNVILTISFWLFKNTTYNVQTRAMILLWYYQKFKFVEFLSNWRTNIISRMLDTIINIVCIYSGTKSICWNCQLLRGVKLAHVSIILTILFLCSAFILEKTMCQIYTKFLSNNLLITVFHCFHLATLATIAMKLSEVICLIHFLETRGFK